MSDSTQQYILRKPLKAFVENDQYDEACYAVVADDGLAWQFMDKESFDELFQPLDIPAIEEQLEKITEKIYYLGVKSGRGVALWPEEESYIDDETFNGEILGLFGLDNKETE